MKNFLVLLWVGLSIISSLSSESNDIRTMRDSLALAMVKEKIENVSEVKYLDLMVPKEFHQQFQDETRGWTREQKIRVLAQAWVESSGWSVMETAPNWDGSRDLGPLGLNSNNLKDPYFMKNYWPKNKANFIYNKNVLYMITCLRFIHAIFGEFGVSKRELINYNAGYSCAIRYVIPTVTQDYIRRVMNQEKIIKDLLTFYAERERARILYLSDLETQTSYFYSDDGKANKQFVPIAYFQPWYERRTFVVHKLPWIRIYNWWESLHFRDRNSSLNSQDELEENDGEHFVMFLI